MGLITVLLFGLAIGSFLNVLIYRLPKGSSVVKGRSYCPVCRHKISWTDNIPLFSFLFLSGKCRHCHKPISLRYPLVEATTGLLFALAVKNSLFSFDFFSLINLFYQFFLISVLITIFFIDLEHQIIPDKLTFLAVLVSFLFLFSFNRSLLFFNSLFSALGATFFFFLLYLLTKGRGMGLGDVKFVFLLGLVLGFPKTVIALYLAFLTGAAIGVILILLRRARFGQKIAFGPFLVLGFLLTFFWGDQLIWLILKFL